MTTRTAARAGGPRVVPADDLAVGWHPVPGHHGLVRWWNGTAWAGRGHAVPLVPSLRGPRPAVVALLAVASASALPLAATLSAGDAFAATLGVFIVAGNLVVLEVVRGIVARSVARRSPPGIGQAGLVPDPSGAHAMRWWDGHRHTEWIADPPAPGHPHEPVMGTDPHTGLQVPPPRPAGERFGIGAWVCALLAILALFTPVTLFVGAPALAVVSGWCTWVCVRNAHRLHEPVPGRVLVATALLVVLVPMTVLLVGMWNAIGNAH